MNKKAKQCSIADILGTSTKKKVVKESNECVVCQKPIPADRLEALKAMNLPRTLWAHTKCSTVQKIKGIYMGEVGTSKLQLCNKVYNDSVRSVFRKTDHEEPDTDPDEDES